MTHPAASVLILVGLLLALLWLAPAVPLLGFAGVLLAVALRLPAEWVAARTGLRRWVSVLALVFGLFGLVGLGAWFAVDPLVDQVNQLLRDLPRAVAAFRERFSGSDLGRWLLARFDPRTWLEDGVGSMASVATGTLGVLGNTVLVLVIGLYFAVRPGGYLRGLRALIHPALEQEASETLAECGTVLRGWLLGQGFAMVFTGVITWLGLLLLGVPLAGALGAITGLLGFIPFLGPIIAAVPAVLLALTISPILAVWVVALFVVVQAIEGDILTPLIQSHAANLPPGLLLLSQILAGALFGLLGVALAAPAAAVAMVLARRAYVEGWLGRRVPADGEGEPPDEPDAPADQAKKESGFAPAPVPARAIR